MEYEDFERPVMGGFDPEAEAYYAEHDRLSQIINEDPEYKMLMRGDFSFLPTTIRDWTEEETEKIGTLFRALSQDLREAERMERIAMKRGERCRRALAAMDKRTDEHIRYKERKAKKGTMTFKEFTAYCKNAGSAFKMLEEENRQASDEIQNLLRGRGAEELEMPEFNQLVALEKKSHNLEKKLEDFCVQALDRMGYEVHYGFEKAAKASQSPEAFDEYNRAEKMKDDFSAATRAYWDHPEEWC